MATTMQCDIVSAEAQIYSGAVELLVATGVEGELGVCFGHAALLTRLIPGPIRVVEAGGEEQVYYASGGFIEVHARTPKKPWQINRVKLITVEPLPSEQKPWRN